MTQTPLCIMLVAAEASGDSLGAGLMQALRRRLGAGVRFVGVGGARMAAEGLQSPFDIAELSILGWAEGLKAYPRVIARADETAALAAREKPVAAVLIDSWGFTMRVAQRLRRQDPRLKLIKYVGPQVWASRPKRARVLAGAVDHLLSILAFDAPYFEAALTRDYARIDPLWLRRTLGAAADEPILLVLPGSRRSEIARLMGPFGDAVARLKASHARLHVVLALAETVAEEARAAADAWPVKPYMIEGETARLCAMRGATVALACSGTVTTELAMAGCPMVVAYRIGALTYALLKHAVTTRWATLINIAVQRTIAPELIQADCTGPRLARAVAERLDDESLRLRQIAEQTEALTRLGPMGGPVPSERAAEAVIAVIEGRAP